MIKRSLQKFFVGEIEHIPHSRLSVLEKHKKDIAKIWNNEQSNDIGIERMFRLTIMAAQYLFPGLYLRNFSSNNGIVLKHLVTELYVFIKILIPIIVLKYELLHSPIYIAVCAYLTVETLLYISSLIFVAEKQHKTYSNRRAFMLLCLNYLEFVFTFAVSHCYFRTLHGLTDRTTDYIYFSFTTSATIGFGELHPTNDIGKVLVVVQTLIFIIFVVLFLNFFGAKMQVPNKKKKEKTKQANSSIET